MQKHNLYEYSIVVLLDLGAGFDTIFHSILMSQLSAIGITGANIIYLSDRQQFVRVDKNRSLFPRGVPQGSVLVHFYFSSTC